MAVSFRQTLSKYLASIIGYKRGSLDAVCGLIRFFLRQSFLEAGEGFDKEIVHADSFKDFTEENVGWSRVKGTKSHPDGGIRVTADLGRTLTNHKFVVKVWLKRIHEYSRKGVLDWEIVAIETEWTVCLVGSDTHYFTVWAKDCVEAVDRAKEIWEPEKFVKAQVYSDRAANSLVETVAL
jgi:hypothetical protein